jgi:FkbM family methyltransferase
MPMTGSGNYSFLCELDDPSCSEVCFAGSHQPRQTALVKRLLEPGMTFLDIGARWGYFSLLAAHAVRAEGSVFSLEPDPVRFCRLLANANKNSLTSIMPLAVAAADQSGQIALQTSISGAEVDIRVAAEPIDELIDSLGAARIDLLKMDVAGAERRALIGMTAGLRSHRYRRILLDLYPAALAARGDDFCEVLDLLIASGYRGMCLEHSPKSNATANLRPLDLSRTLRDRVSLLWHAPGENL